MSAYLVSKWHIDVLVYARTLVQYRGGRLDRLSDVELGRMLWRENMKSLAARYDDPIDEAALAGYVYQNPPRSPQAILNCAIGPSAIACLKAIHGYEYQACEHREWSESDAHAYCQELSHALVMRFPGYADAPRDIEEPGPDAEPAPISILDMMAKRTPSAPVPIRTLTDPPFRALRDTVKRARKSRKGVAS